MSTISVRTHFAAGHRILGLTGSGAKCRNIHGHTFHVTWTFEQGTEMALEFGELKARLKGIISTHFDHSFVLDASDDFCHYLKVNDLRYYPLDGPPTTEAIAAEIARLSIDRLTKPAPKDQFHSELPALWPDAQLVAVILDEGPENSATWQPPSPTAREVFGQAGVDYDEAMQGRWAPTTVVAGGPGSEPPPR